MGYIPKVLQLSDLQAQSSPHGGLHPREEHPGGPFTWQKLLTTSDSSFIGLPLSWEA